MGKALVQTCEDAYYTFKCSRGLKDATTGLVHAAKGSNRGGGGSSKRNGKENKKSDIMPVKPLIVDRILKDGETVLQTRGFKKLTTKSKVLLFTKKENSITIEKLCISELEPI